MANPVCEVVLTEAALQPADEAQAGSGAVVDFFGVVRPLEHDREIRGIKYEAHPEMAPHQLDQIAREAINKFGLDSAIIRHRVGFVHAGEASVFVRTTSHHRAESYRANQWIMDQLKERAPIWKRPEFKTSGRIGPDIAMPASTR
jgi:molybdopterin synthase catalytic subunit